jgi:stage IV sporulation protein A
MVMANIETEVSPAIGGEKASEEVINFLLQGNDGDMSRIWEAIFSGNPSTISPARADEQDPGHAEDAQEKLRTTIQRIVNEGSGGLICILL